MYTLASISPPTTMFAAHRKSRALGVQGKDFPPALNPWVMHLKRPGDEERTNPQAVSTRNPPGREAQGLGRGAITVPSHMAAYRHHGHHREGHAATPRGNPDARAAVPLQPVMRA